MKKLLLIALSAISLFGMGGDVIESLTVCKGKDMTLLITIIQAQDNKNDRAIFVNDFEALNDTTLEYFIPIQNPKSFRSTKSIEKWTSEVFGKVNCSPIDEKTVEEEYKSQR